MLHFLWALIRSTWWPESGRGYAFFSGPGSDLGELAIVAALAGLLRKHNCAVRGCLRIGRHKVPGTEHVCCAKHTPGGAPTHAHILRLHREHIENLTEAPKEGSP